MASRNSRTKNWEFSGVSWSDPRPKGRRRFLAEGCRSICIEGAVTHSVSRPSYNLSRNGQAAMSRDTDVTNWDLGASRGATRG